MKKWIALLLAACMLFALIGCAKSEPKPAEEPAPVAEMPTEADRKSVV